MTYKIFFQWFLVLLFSGQLAAQTVGLLAVEPGANAGYTLFSKQGKTFLIDQGGEAVHSWITGNTKTHPGYLQDNGDLLAVDRGVKRFSWDGELLWEYKNVDANHDIAMLPNGNILLLVKERKTREESIQAGRNPERLNKHLYSLSIIEINDQGDVVWDWHLWDHLVQDLDPEKDNYGTVKEHPELIDINYVHRKKPNWVHLNAIDYNAKLDHILITPRNFNEVWIIDHSTSRKESAGHSGGNAGKGGDLIYRWGNPDAYGAGGIAEQKLFGSHAAHWIADGLKGAGNILVFNNGGERYGRDGNYSSVDEFKPAISGHSYELNQSGAYLPQSLIWTYQAPSKMDFFGPYRSGAQRLENGNTFIVEGMTGLMFEVTEDGKVVWKYQSPVAKELIIKQGDNLPNLKQGPTVFNAHRYAPDHPGLVGRKLLSKGPIEKYEEFAAFSVESAVSGMIAYPGEGNFRKGVGQLISLVAEENEQYKFSGWTVISGSVSLKDPASLHTSLVLLNSDDVIIKANYTPILK